MPAASSGTTEPSKEPVLPPPRGLPRTEWKLLLPRGLAQASFAAARRWMQPDPHAGDPADASYSVASLYFDTSTLACFAQRADAELPKYRVRRYGSAAGLFVEEKLRRGEQVWKRRAPMAGGGLDRLFREAPDPDPATAWFRGRLQMLGLRPVLTVFYLRHALVGARGERLTIDLGMRALPAGQLPAPDSGAAIVPDTEAVLEVKFTGAPTPLVQELRARFDREPAAFSKYRRAVLALGLGGAGS